MNKHILNVGVALGLATSLANPSVGGWVAKPTAPILSAPMTYPGLNPNFQMIHHWPLNSASGGRDVLNGFNLTPLAGYATDCKQTSIDTQMADHCLYYNANNPMVLSPGSKNFAACGTIVTKDGHYNWLQDGTSRTHVPWGFFKLGTYAFDVSGTLAKVQVKSGLTHSDGIKHYLCGQRVGDTFSIIMDGKTLNSVVAHIGSVDFDPVSGPHGFMVGGKYAANLPLNEGDMYNGKTWNIQWGEF